jgi:hypothetical protein
VLNLLAASFFCADKLLDPLLPLLVRALRSRHAPSVTTALQALSLLMQSELPGLQKTAAGECTCMSQPVL